MIKVVNSFLYSLSSVFSIDSPRGYSVIISYPIAPIAQISSFFTSFLGSE
jgi:hypothetical protein